MIERKERIVQRKLPAAQEAAVGRMGISLAATTIVWSLSDGVIR